MIKVLRDGSTISYTNNLELLRLEKNWEEMRDRLDNLFNEEVGNYMWDEHYYKLQEIFKTIKYGSNDNA